MKKMMQFLVMVRKKIHDSYSPKNYVWRTVMVPRPTLEVPYPCILVSLSTGPKTKVLVRVTSLEEYDNLLRLTEEERVLVQAALFQANIEVDETEAKMRLAWDISRKVRKGESIINGTTGEVLGEIADFLKDRQNG